jgi:hypothetical protein
LRTGTMENFITRTAAHRAVVDPARLSRPRRERHARLIVADIVRRALCGSDHVRSSRKRTWAEWGKRRNGSRSRHVTLFEE